MLFTYSYYKTPHTRVSEGLSCLMQETLELQNSALALSQWGETCSIYRCPSGVIRKVDIADLLLSFLSRNHQRLKHWHADHTSMFVLVLTGRARSLNGLVRYIIIRIKKTCKLQKSKFTVFQYNINMKMDEVINKVVEFWSFSLGNCWVLKFEYSCSN